MRKLILPSSMLFVLTTAICYGIATAVLIVGIEGFTSSLRLVSPSCQVERGRFTGRLSHSDRVHSRN